MIIDLHADTFHEMFNDENIDFIKNKLHIDYNKLKKGKSLLQCFALFSGYDDDNACAEMIAKRKYFDDISKKYNNYIEICKCFDDIEKINKSGRIAVLKTIENLGPIKNIEDIDELNKENYKIISLTWNYENKLAYPSSKNENDMQKGLKQMGHEAIEKINSMNILIDVSHISDKGFYDIYDKATKPIIATHSNSRSLCNVPRNLTDDMIKKIADKGGVIGINFYHKFLSDIGYTSVYDIANHIDYITKIAGSDIVALGTDFDGISGEMEIGNFSELYKLNIELEKRGYTSSDIEKINYKNAMRVLKLVL